VASLSDSAVAGWGSARSALSGPGRRRSGRVSSSAPLSRVDLAEARQHPLGDFQLVQLVRQLGPIGIEAPERWRRRAQGEQPADQGERQRDADDRHHGQHAAARQQPEQ